MRRDTPKHRGKLSHLQTSRSHLTDCVAVRGAAGGGARVQGEADRGGGGQDLTVLQPPHLLHRRHLQVLRQDPRLQRSLQGGQGAALQISLSRAFHPSPFTQVS